LGKYPCRCCGSFAVQHHDVVGVVFDTHVGDVDGEALGEVSQLVTPIRSCLGVWR
jgi:hypothetical protein